MDMRWGTWHVVSLYRAGLQTTVAREMALKSYLVGVHEVIWEKGATEPAGDYTFSCGKGDVHHELGTGFFCVYKNIISAVKRVELVGDKKKHTCIILRSRWCDVIVLNIYAPPFPPLHVG
jgi:hypothetical protein